MADVAPRGDTHWVFTARRGFKMKVHLDVEDYTGANVLPRMLLHPTIEERVWATLLDGTMAVGYVRR
jgi:hypothetical protein